MRQLMIAFACAAAVLAVPASAQAPAQVRPGITVAPQATVTIPGQLSLAGTWHMTSPNCSRLTLTRDANRHVSGTMRMGTCGLPDFTGVELPCSGYQHPTTSSRSFANTQAGSSCSSVGWSR